MTKEMLKQLFSSNTNKQVFFQSQSHQHFKESSTNDVKKILLFFDLRLCNVFYYKDLRTVVTKSSTPPSNKALTTFMNGLLEQLFRQCPSPKAITREKLQITLLYEKKVCEMHTLTSNKTKIQVFLLVSPGAHVHLKLRQNTLCDFTFQTHSNVIKPATAKSGLNELETEFKYKYSQTAE
jgi:hypothetical protein